MRKHLATLFRKLANWLDPIPSAPPPATVQGGGPGSTPPPPQAD